MNSRLPLIPVYLAADVRAADLIAQREHGLPGAILMRAAAACALADLRERWPQAVRLVIVCGAGNNGGDGYAMAVLAKLSGLEPLVVAVGEPTRLQGDALAAYHDWRSAGGDWQAAAALPALLQTADVAVDALFGTGLTRPLEGPWRAAVEALNAAPCPVQAIDLPSGLDANHGWPVTTATLAGTAVRAQFTSTFVGWKPGVLLGAAYTGQVRLHSLGVPAAAFGHAVPQLWQIPTRALLALPARARDAHKGRHGHVMVLGGDEGMPGAVRLAGEAALRAGAGRVTVWTRGAHVGAVVAGCPELMVREAGSACGLRERLAAADAIVCGPGLGRWTWSREVLADALAAAGDRPLVLDADALALLPVVAAGRALPPCTVLTPHPGEAARLLGITVAQVQADRVAAVRCLADRWQATVVLKGAGTLIAGPGEVAPVVCERGNPGMGTAGLGDVLAGVCGALLAQDRCDPAWAFGPAARTALVALAVLAHACAGDLAATVGGERGLIATDLFAPLRLLMNGREVPG